MKRVVVSFAAIVWVSVVSISLAGCGGGSISGGGGNGNPPTITSFMASSATISAGSSSNLTAVFSGGTGVITAAGGFSANAISGTPVSVSPTATTTYTLTVTSSTGLTATATAMVTVTAATTPTITSFIASPATIEAGSSSSLTAVFTGGTGVITPGNISVVSGTAVNVSPTTTTTYTLTVTPTSGTAVTAMATVTVDPVPTITSFTASASPIEAGSSSSLTAVFAGGTGVITPGNISVTSGVAAPVNPTTTTAYTLTVTPPVGSVTATMMATVTVDPVPSITSFGASPATIEAGSSSSLTAVFTGGTGVLTPGNISVVSGTAVAVSPTTTTAYTLTVTPPVGSVTATMMATVTVDPVPTITSFSANPTSISSGGSSSLTAVFTGGTGVITPGNISVTSGTPVSVSPTATTTYTLTVTPPVGSVTATMTATVTVGSGAANITSFTANPTTIGAGSSSQLVGYFTGGTGVITPGNTSATSGTAVSVSPTATTTYTLTVTPTGGGTAATKTATVTVDPAPVITSFTASPTTIVAGNSTSLSASFTGGAGVITPGNLSITSGTPLNVSPTATTTYTLTVTPPVGTAATQTAMVTVETGVMVSQSSSGPAVTDQLLGMNMAVWDDFTANTSTIVDAFKGAGIAALRWPGGSTSDDYHWNGMSANPANGTAPVPGTCAGAYQDSNTNYLNFINELENAISGGYDVALTADYGTNPACTGGGDPTEAANWVKYAYANGGTVSHVTVGNEEYGSWEEDMHTKEHDPATYAASVTGTSGYFDLIKAANSSTLVGVDVDANNNCCAAGWDTTVLKNAAGSYDFVEFHYYPQNPGDENDSYLVTKAAQDFTTNINTIKQELVSASEPDTPIYVGEMGSVSSNPGKQSMSITQGLYAGQMLGEMMNDGVSRATWWIGFGNCNGNAGYMGTASNPIYGWQDWGAYNVFSDGTEDPTCPNYGSFGNMSPTAAAFDLFQHVAVNGENVLTANVAGDATDVRAYAATHSGGTALVLFNLNETTSETVSVSFSTGTSSPGVTEYTYDKSIYDLTNSPTLEWNGPTTTALGSQPLPMTVTLTPWSMNVFIIQ
jgi:hypothetical protein